MPVYKLWYFDLPARGETARLLFRLADQEFEDIRISKEDWPKLKPTFPFGQLPVLQVDDVTICQSHAINRLLARRFGFAGRTELEKAQVDMVANCIEDVVTMCRPVYHAMNEGQETEKLAALRKSLEEPAQAALSRLETMLISNSGGDTYFVGDQLTWADIHLLVRKEYFERTQMPVVWDKLPKLSALQQRVAAQTKIAEWIAIKSGKLQFRLTYFDMPGRAEVSCLLFALAGQPYEDVRLTREQWVERKHEAPFGQLPLLEVNGTTLCQSNACHRYLARLFGYAGRTDVEQARADMLVDCLEDFVTAALLPVHYAADDAQKTAMMAKAEGLTAPFLQKLEKEMSASGTEYLASNTLTWADVSFYNVMSQFPWGFPVPWQDCPRLKAAYDRVTAMPQIRARAEKSAVPK